MRRLESKGVKFGACNIRVKPFGFVDNEVYGFTEDTQLVSNAFVYSS
jgi:hypothetical protein